MEINARFTAEVLFKSRHKTVKATLVAAVGSGANLRGANLRGANLRVANLSDANLWGANLSDANLWGANLSDANLWGADLRGADLRGADLRDANLSGANLSDANLWGANLSDANLWGANLSGAKNIISVGPTADGYIFYAVPHETCVMIAAGCRWLSIEEARAHWIKTRSGTDIGAQRLRYVDFIEAEARALGWIREAVRETK